MDVRDPLAVQVGAEQAVGLLGGGDLVVNNVGIGMRTVNPRFLEQPMAFFEVSAEGFSDVVATDLTGYFLVARAFAPLFVEQRRGRFVNVSMNHETMHRRGFVPYGPARAGAEALSAIMVEDLRPYGVTANILCRAAPRPPGWSPTQSQRRPARASYSLTS
jgi:gluconate 5-dehydrogenase